MAKPSLAEVKENWEKIIYEQHNSGLSIASWCHQNNIRPNKFFYWKKKLFSKSEISRSSFTEIKEIKSPHTEIIIEYRGFIIRINHSVEPLLLQNYLEVLKKC